MTAIKETAKSDRNGPEIKSAGSNTKRKDGSTTKNFSLKFLKIEKI